MRDLPALGTNSREKVRANGGSRKVEGVKKLADRFGVSLEEIVVVADSIIDINMLRAVKEAGGLAVVFNGNRFALPEGNVGLATTDMWYLRHLLSRFWREGLPGVKKFISESQKMIRRNKEGALIEGTIPARCDFFEGGVLKNEVENAHAEMRRIVRGAEGRLG